MLPFGTEPSAFSSAVEKLEKTIIFPVVLYGRETWALTLMEEHRLEGV
jgi:hypothetical protein